MDEKKIGQLIKKLRENKSKSQQQLADDLHVSRTLVTKWESGKIALTTQNLKSLSEYFNISTDEILAGEEKNSENVEMIENIKYKLYDSNNLLKKKAKIYFSSIITLIFCFLVYFFVTFYNSVKVYTINVDEDSNMEIKNGILVKTRDKIYLRLEPKLLNKTMEVESIKLYYKINGEIKDVLKLDSISAISINDFYEEQEYFDFNKFDSIKNNLYIKITYKDNVEENLSFKLKRDYVNSKLFFIKRNTSKEKIEEDVSPNKIFDDIMSKNLEDTFSVNYNKKEYNIRILDSQIYIIYEFNNKKEKLVYDTFDGVYFNKESSGKIIYSYSINDNICIIGDCENYVSDYKMFLEILKLTEKQM